MILRPYYVNDVVVTGTNGRSYITNNLKAVAHFSVAV